MRHMKPFLIFLLALTSTMMSSCGGGGGDTAGSGIGTLSIGITDSSTTRYKAVYITIDEVQVNRDSDAGGGNSGWVTVATPGQTYNLLKLVGGLTAVLGSDELEAGSYYQIRLKIGKQAQSENNMLGVPHPYANYVILNDGSDTVEALKIPSGMQTGIKLVHNFQVVKDAVVELVLDFDACRSVVETGDLKYLLKPTIRVTATENKLTLQGRVDDATTGSPVTGAMVSAQISDGLSASVVRATLTSDDAGYEGLYSMILSPDQGFNIVVFSDQKTGEPGSEQMYAPACDGPVVLADSTASRDFTLEKTDFGAISCDVHVDGAIDPNDRPVVYINFYRMLDCGYVELVSLPVSPDPVSNTVAFSVDLPLGTYDVVASGEGLTPDTAASTEISSPGETVHVNLNL
jgi:hypothetical protein